MYLQSTLITSFSNRYYVIVILFYVTNETLNSSGFQKYLVGSSS